MKGDNDNFGRETFEKEWENIKQKNREEDMKAKQLLEQIRLSQQKSAAVMSELQQTQRKIAQTLLGVKGTLKDIKETNDKIDTFEREYSEALKKLAERCALGLSDPIKRIAGREYSQLPRVVSMTEAVSQMMKYNRILFLTGAGISAPSGIPTFRGTGGFWTHRIQDKEEEFDAHMLLTTLFFKERPELVWKWHDDFRRRVESCKPNQGHHNLDKCCEQLSNRQKDITIITQNLDNLQPVPKNYKFFHIHGDINYIRCQGPQRHLQPYNSTPDKCKQCGEQMRPHTLFFDEPCMDLAAPEIKEMNYDFVVSIGTALETTLAKRLVVNAKEVIEINPEPVIEVGNVYTFKGDAVIILNEMLAEIIKYK